MPEEPKIPTSQEIVRTSDLNALAQLKGDLKSLTSSTSIGVSDLLLLDIPERLTRLARSVENASPTVNLSRANHIHAAVFRFATRPRIGKFAKFKLTLNTLDAVRRVFTATTRALAPKFRARKHQAQVEAFIRRCISSLYDCCELAENCVAWTYVLEYVRDSARHIVFCRCLRFARPASRSLRTN